MWELGQGAGLSGSIEGRVNWAVAASGVRRTGTVVVGAGLGCSIHWFT